MRIPSNTTPLQAPTRTTQGRPESGVMLQGLFWWDEKSSIVPRNGQVSTRSFWAEATPGPSATSAQTINAVHAECAIASQHRHAAVHMQGRPGHVGRFRRGEKQDAGRDLLRRAQPSGGHAGE